MQRVASNLLRLQCRLSKLSCRAYSSDDPNVDKLLGGLLPKEDRQALKDKLLAIEKEAYNTAMPSQTQELFAETEHLLQDISVKKDSVLPSRSYLRRETTKALVALKREMYIKAIQDGLNEEDARKLADNVVEKAAIKFQEKQDSELGKLQDEKAAETEKEVQMGEKEQKIFDLAYQMFEEIVAPDQTQVSRIQRIQINPQPKAPKIFSTTKAALNYFNVKKLKPTTTTFWASMEARKAEITNLSMGPENAFDEQILWTEQGKLWPYPINNEYLLGDEEKIHFTEHIFLEEYLKKHKELPKDGPIGHFMHLVCVGLSKNPYMTLQKKHAHLDSFAEFFNPAMIKKVHKMHADAQATDH